MAANNWRADHVVILTLHYVALHHWSLSTVMTTWKCFHIDGKWSHPSILAVANWWSDEEESSSTQLIWVGFNKLWNLGEVPVLDLLIILLGGVAHGPGPLFRTWKVSSRHHWVDSTGPVDRVGSSTVTSVVTGLTLGLGLDFRLIFRSMI